MSENLLELGRAAIAAQPFRRLLGCEKVRFERGRVELSVPISTVVDAGSNHAAREMGLS